MLNNITRPQTARIFLRKPSPTLGQGGSITIGIPDATRAASQHQALCDTLSGCNVAVTVLQADPLFPDSTLINDTAVVTETLAVIGNFAADGPRQGEQKSVAAQLAGSHFLKFITAPGLLDARDVLQIGEHFYIGLSPRTNQEGAAQLAYFLTEYGFAVEVLDLSGIDGCSPLRTAAVWLGHDRLLIQESLARHYSFLAYEKIIVPQEEKGATRGIVINGTLLLPAGYARVASELKLWNIPFQTVNVSEFEKMGGGLSSLTLCLPPRAASTIVSLPEKISRAA